jgi:hypothetical protein
LIENNEVGGACSTYGDREDLHRGFWWGSLRERDHLEDPNIGGRIILKRRFKWDESMEWIDLAGEGGGLL